MSVTLNAGAGGATCGTDTVPGTPNIDYQIVKLGHSTSGTAPTQVSTGNPLPTVQTGALPAGANTIGNVNAIQSGAWSVNLGTLNGAALDTSVNGLLIAQGSATSGAKGPLIQGAVTTAAPAYTTAQTSPLSLTPAGALRTDASATTQPVSAAALPLPAGASTAAKQPALGTAGVPAADVITVQGVASMTALKVDGSGVTQPVSGTFWQATQPVSGTVTANAGSGTFAVNLSQVAGSAIALGQTTMSASLPVAIASNQSALPAVQSGTWTVQPGNTANTTPWLVSLAPATGNGWSKFSTPKNNTNTPLTNTVVSVKASAAGELGGYIVYNPNASVAYIQVFDVATAGGVTLGTTRPDMVIPVPPTSGANLELANGVNFANGIQIAATTTDSGSTAPGTGLTVTMVYK